MYWQAFIKINFNVISIETYFMHLIKFSKYTFVMMFQFGTFKILT